MSVPTPRRSVADIDTQPLPAARAERPAAPSRASRVASALADVETLRLPAVSGRRPAAAAGVPRRLSTLSRRWASQPWLLRVALVLGVIALAVRAGFASVAFMLPGGSILGWSQLPQAHCVLCHLPQPTGTAQANHPLTPSQYAALLVQQLTLDQEVGQLMLAQFVGTTVNPDIVQMINAEGVSGVLYFSSNIRSPAQLRALNAQLQSMASIPLLISVDQEGGTVNRFLNVLGPLPGASDLKTTTQAQQRGVQDASYLHDYGFNLNLAPVVDVGTSNPQLAGRTFGSTPDRVTQMAGAYLAGLQQSALVTGVLKHFPGLGSTTTDPHIGLPILKHTRDQWEQLDLAPYRALLATEDVRAIMVTHVMYPLIDPTYPASLSPAMIDGVLRGELGFQGVVVTDSLYMGALNQRWSVPQAAVLAIKAGADLVIGPYNPQLVQQTKDALEQAVSNGTLSKARIDLSVQRVLTLKIQMGLIPLPSQQGGQTPTPTAQASATLVARLPD